MSNNVLAAFVIISLVISLVGTMIANSGVTIQPADVPEAQARVSLTVAKLPSIESAQVSVRVAPRLGV